MKLYIAQATCSLAVQLVANELGLKPELIHYDVFGKTTTSNDNFAEINPLGYVPVVQLDTQDKDLLSETTVITAYLADLYPEAGLIPPRGSLERVLFDQLQNFIATEIAQKHIPLMRKLMTEEGTAWTRNKLVAAYTVLDQRLADGRAYLMGEELTVVDAYVWATMWQARSGAQISHLENLMAYIARVEALPSAQKALRDEAKLVTLHQAQKAAAAAATAAA